VGINQSWRGNVMFSNIIKSSKALELLEYNLEDHGNRDKPISKIEYHLIKQAENFLTDQMRDVENALLKSNKKGY
jgi:hypothetical protein